MTYEDERAEILKLPCQCVRCPDCGGRGLQWVASAWGQWPEDDVESCGYCNGSGVSEDCDRCRDLDELEEAFRETA